MKWRRCVVLCLACIVGPLLYLAWRIVEGGATALILSAAAIASKLGCTEITSLSDAEGIRTPRSLRQLVCTILPPLVDRCINSGGHSTSAPNPPSSDSSAPSGRAGADAGVERRTRFTSKHELS